MKKNVLLINQGKTENLGDIAINETIKKILEELECKVQTVGFAQCSEQTMQRMNFKGNIMLSYLKQKLPNILKWFLKYHWDIKREIEKVKKLDEIDMVIIGGGQLLKHKSVFLFCLFSWIYMLNKRKISNIFLVGIGMDTYFNPLEKIGYNFLLKKIKKIYSREKYSISKLKKEFNIKAEYIPDVVFAYSRYNELKLLKKDYLLVMIYSYETLTKHFEKKISKIEYYQEWIKLIEKYKKNLKIILAYTTIEDKIETLNFYEYLLKQTNIKCEIRNTDTLDKFVDTLLISHSLITGRMHGMILGYNYQCKLVPYYVSNKIRNFKREYLEKSNNLKLLETEVLNVFESIIEA